MNLFIKLLLVVKSIKNFPQAILDRLGLIDGEVIYYLRNNTVFFARTKSEDLSEIAVVASGSEYNFKNISLPKKPVIVDLGGHIGSFCIPTAKKFKDKCKIFVFEADEQNFKLLNKNIRLNKVKSIISVNVAISDYNGKGFLKTKNLNTDAYHLDKNSKYYNCSVKSIPNALNKFNLKKIDLMKIDIEGEEPKIFNHRTSFKYIVERVNYIFIEVDNDFNESEMKRSIEKKFKFLSRHKNIITYKNNNL